MRWLDEGTAWQCFFAGSALAVTALAFLVFEQEIFALVLLIPSVALIAVSAGYLQRHGGRN